MKLQIKSINVKKENVEMNLFFRDHGNMVDIMATDHLGKEWVIATISEEGLRLWSGLPEYFPVNKENNDTILITK